MASPITRRADVYEEARKLPLRVIPTSMIDLVDVIYGSSGRLSIHVIRTSAAAGPGRGDFREPALAELSLRSGCAPGDERSDDDRVWFGAALV